MRRNELVVGVVIALLCFGAGYAINGMLGQPSQPTPAKEVTVLAAGSLTSPFTNLSDIFEREYGITVNRVFQPSGILRGQIEIGAPCDVYASASLEHPKKLVKEGYSRDYVVFAHNELCFITPAENPAGITADNWIERLKDPETMIITSTPKADPCGDYTWRFFEKNGLNVTSHANRQLGSIKVLPVITSGNGDVGIIYLSEAVKAEEEGAKIDIIRIPSEYNVGADYGICMLSNTTASGEFLAFVLSMRGQRIMEEYGFVPAAVPFYAS
jgi:molybdate transport system substrate-binding protein